MLVMAVFLMLHLLSKSYYGSYVSNIKVVYTCVSILYDKVSYVARLSREFVAGGEHSHVGEFLWYRDWSSRNRSSVDFDCLSVFHAFFSIYLNPVL